MFTLFISQNSFSQSNKFSFALFGGYSVPASDLKGNIEDFNTNYHMKNGFNAGGAVKYNLDRKGCFQTAVSLVYNGFSNSADQSSGGVTITSKVNINILSLDIGGQYNFMPNKKINPYINLDLTNNFISGNSTTLGSIFSSSADLKSTWRGGLQFGAGVDLAFSDKVGVLFGVNYNLANLIGKSYDSLSTDPLVYTLDDKEYTFAGTSVPTKSISYIQIYTGISIFLNRSVSR